MMMMTDHNGVVAYELRKEDGPWLGFLLVKSGG